MTAPSNNTSGSQIIQAAENGDYSLWTFNLTSDGYFNIQSKNQYIRNASSPLYLGISGSNVVQTTSTASNKWCIDPLVMRLNIMYDQSFVQRYGLDYMHVLHEVFSDNSIGKSIADVYKEKFGILVRVTFSSSQYTSHPYTDNCAEKNDINEICLDCKSLLNETDYDECRAGTHHKTELEFVHELPNVPLHNSTCINIAFVGYKACHAYEDTDDQGNVVYKHKSGYANGRSTTNNSRIAIYSHTRYDDIINGVYDIIIRTTTHETLHSFGASHCEKTNLCIMNNQTTDVTQNLTICSTCVNRVNNNKLKLYNHQ